MTRMSTVEFNCTIPRHTPLPTALHVAIYFSVSLSITYCNFTSYYWGEREETPHTWRMGAMFIHMSCTHFWMFLASCIQKNSPKPWTMISLWLLFGLLKGTNSNQY